MSIEEFSEYLVSNIAKESDLVKVKKFETEEGTIIEILVSEVICQPLLEEVELLLLL